MKTIKKTAILLALIVPAYFYGQDTKSTTQTKDITTAQKFDVTIIQAAGPNENKLGVSISNHADRFQYTFQWKVDRKSVGHRPTAKAKEGQKIELLVTRYPGGDQSSASLQLETIDTPLPLYPKKAHAKGLLAGN